MFPTGLVIGEKFHPEFVEAFFQNGLPRLPHQGKQGMNVVNGDQGGCQHLFGNDEVSEISPAESAAGVTGTGFINGTRVSGKPGIHQVQSPGKGHCRRVTRQPGG